MGEEVPQRSRDDRPRGSVRYDYTGSDRGWKGDVPIIRLNIDKIRGLGWQPTRTSADALRDAMVPMLSDLRSGLDQGAA